MERQIRYWVEPASPPSTGEETLRWNVLVINEPREITGVHTKIKTTIPPTEDFRTLADGVVPKSGGLHYNLSSFYTHDIDPRKVEWRMVYGGRVVEDRKLATRKTSKGLPNYVRNAIKKGEFS